MGNLLSQIAILSSNIATRGCLTGTSTAVNYHNLWAGNLVVRKQSCDRLSVSWDEVLRIIFELLYLSFN
jgi:hypothetical protein